MVKLSPELRTKIKREMKLQNQDFLPDFICGELKFGDNELKLFYECVRWFFHMNTYFKTSYLKNQVKIDSGKYKGIYPFKITYKEVTFLIDHIIPSWKDWFIQEE